MFTFCNEEQKNWKHLKVHRYWTGYVNYGGTYDQWDTMQPLKLIECTHKLTGKNPNPRYIVEYV